MKFEDIISVDVPLFIRLLEFAREDAKGDLDLHVVAENIISLSIPGQILTMDNYNDILKDAAKEDFSQEDDSLLERFQRLVNII